jgi:hypothetical protein
MKAVQEILRHAKLATTEPYVRKTTAQARRALKLFLDGWRQAKRTEPSGLDETP